MAIRRMSVACDGHIHLYPEYSLPAALRILASNLPRLAGTGLPSSEPVFCAALMAEARECRFFRRLRDRAPADRAAFSVEDAGEPAALRIIQAGLPCVHVIAGRQTVTRERIEILALATDADVPGDAGTAETLRAIRDAGGIPVVNWAPGKWLAERGRFVRALLEQSRPGDFLLGDTALRPASWREPPLMRFAQDKGFGVVRGSDPLPFPGEENLLGTYGFAYEGPFDPDRPVTSIRQILASGASAVTAAGRRCGSARALWRTLKALAAKKSANAVRR